ncbi:Rho-binding antiterminator [Sulfurospirillum sp. 1612]|uniref:Rho-binding antiterminator n=1 Tax=Sulfurospirillum sp. 1612 TaxID=3094835 RepID=UPI002F940299
MISCAHYDYIEIACLYHYDIKLTLKSGEVIEGRALDTARNSDLKECIKIKTSVDEPLIVLDDIMRLQIKTKNPHFQSVSFT